MLFLKCFTKIEIKCLLAITSLTLQSHQAKALSAFDSHVAYPGIPPKDSNHTLGKISTCHRTLFSEYSDQSLTQLVYQKRGFSTSITLKLYLAQSHCAGITKHGIPFVTSQEKFNSVKRYVHISTCFLSSGVRTDHSLLKYSKT